eukprot:15459108-Alexandrium_andersonii.AAC.1
MVGGVWQAARVSTRGRRKATNPPNALWIGFQRFQRDPGGLPPPRARPPKKCLRRAPEVRVLAGGSG